MRELGDESAVGRVDVADVSNCVSFIGKWHIP